MGCSVALGLAPLAFRARTIGDHLRHWSSGRQRAIPIKIFEHYRTGTKGFVMPNTEPDKWYLAVDCSKCGEAIPFAEALRRKKSLTRSFGR